MDSPDKSKEKRAQIFCQNCRKANRLNDTHCQHCGTRLLLLVFPNSLQYDTNVVPTFYEDHLLERVTLLELRQAQILERIEAASEYLKQGFETFHKDRLLLQTLIETIESLNPELGAIITKKSNEAYRDKQDRQKSALKESLAISEILIGHDQPNGELFSHLIGESSNLFSQGEEKQGFRMLERTALLSPRNVALHCFIAEKLFVAEKFVEAKSHLEKVYSLAPHNPKLLLLLGAILADEGDAKKARQTLDVPTNNQRSMVAANYIRGMLAAEEGNWSEGRTAFQSALKSADAPELHYLIGCIYFQMKNWAMALKHLQRAVALDSSYVDSWFMQSVIHRTKTDAEAEKSALAAAGRYQEAGGQCLEYLKGKKQASFEYALPFTHFKKKNPRLLTGGAVRLTRFFREQMLLAID